MADKYQIPFINACIRSFAKRVGLPVRNVFQYLYRFKGVDFLVDFYPTLHLQSVDDTVDDLIVMCKNGLYGQSASYVYELLNREYVSGRP